MKKLILIFYIIINKVIEIKEMEIKLPIRSELKLTGWSVWSEFDTDYKYARLNYRKTAFISILQNSLMLHSDYAEYHINFKIDYDDYYYYKIKKYRNKKNKKDKKEKNNEKDNEKDKKILNPLDEEKKYKRKKNKRKDLIFIFNLDNELREISETYLNYKTELSGIAIVGILNLKTNKLEISLHKNLEMYEFNFKKDIELFLNKKDNIHELDFPLDYIFKLKIDYKKNIFILEIGDKEIFKLNDLNSYLYNKKCSFHLYSFSKKIINSFLLRNLKVFKDTELNDLDYSDKEYNKLIRSFKNHGDSKKEFESVNFIDLVKNQIQIKMINTKIYDYTLNISYYIDDLKNNLRKKYLSMRKIENNEKFNKKLHDIFDSFNEIIDTQKTIKEGFKSLESTIHNLEKINDLKIESLDKILKDWDIIINLNEMKDIVENINIIHKFMKSSDFEFLNKKLKKYLDNDEENNISNTLLFFGFIVLGVILGLLIIVSLKINKARKLIYYNKKD